MKRKLNLVLRDPVKLHSSNQNVEDLPSPFNKQEKIETNIEKREEKKESNPAAAKEEKNKIKKISEKPTPKIEEKIVSPNTEISDLRKEMSLRIKQVWEYFCRKANADNELKNSFTVTRGEVMREAGIGSTNTYRDALKKMQSLELIKIELRPGVIAGSVFYLTEIGLEQANLVLQSE